MHESPDAPSIRGPHVKPRGETRPDAHVHGRPGGSRILFFCMGFALPGQGGARVLRRVLCEAPKGHVKLYPRPTDGSVGAAPCLHGRTCGGGLGKAETRVTVVPGGIPLPRSAFELLVSAFPHPGSGWLWLARSGPGRPRWSTPPSALGVLAPSFCVSVSWPWLALVGTLWPRLAPGVCGDNIRLLIPAGPIGFVTYRHFTSQNVFF